MSETVWYCVACGQRQPGNPRRCVRCGHTVYRPVSETKEDGTKYVVIPGPVRSATDGQIRYVGEHDLIRLYEVNRSECITRRRDDKRPIPEHLIRLVPRGSGRYELPRPKGRKGGDRKEK